MKKIVYFMLAILFCTSFFGGEKSLAKTTLYHGAVDTDVENYEYMYVNKKNELWIKSTYSWAAKPMTKIADNIKCIIEDKDGRFVITTDNELCALDPTNNYKRTHILNDVKDMNGYLILKNNGDVYELTQGWGMQGYTYSTKKIMKKVKKIYDFGQHDYRCVFVIKKDNSLWGYGFNEYGQMANGTTEDVSTPIKIMDDVKELYYCRHFGMNTTPSLFFALKTDGSLYAWGYNDADEIPYEASCNAGMWGTDVNTKPILIMENVKSFSGDGCFVTVLQKDGTLWAWGQVCDHWEGMTAYTSWSDVTQIATKVKQAGTILYNGINTIYYIDSKNRLMAKAAQLLDEPGKVCLKKVKSYDVKHKVAFKTDGKMYGVKAFKGLSLDLGKIYVTKDIAN